MPNFCSCGFVVHGTVDGKDNKEEKTRAVLVDNVEVTRMLLKHQGLDLMNLDVGSLVGGQG